MAALKWWDPVALTWKEVPVGGGRHELATWHSSGAAVVADGAAGYRVYEGGTIVAITVVAAVAPGTTSFDGHINKNGVLAESFSLAAGSTALNHSCSVTVVAGDVLTLDITAVGTTPAEDVTVQAIIG